VPSKRRLATSRKKKQLEHEPCFLLDRSLGRYKLAAQLRAAGMNVIAGDDVYPETERDPWIFYDCGKQGRVVITSDKDFMKSFPHMAAVSLGNTTVIAFTSNNYNSNARGRAFMRARGKVSRALLGSNGIGFIGSVGMEGTFSIVQASPTPNKKYCDERDWKSYERVCASEGVRYEKLVASPDPVLGSAPGPAEDHTAAKVAEAKADSSEKVGVDAKVPDH
jgi:predicted nuclease of predicted toxin-antitoxin system